MKIKEFLKKRKLNIIFSASAIFLMWVIWIIAYYAVRNEYIIPSFTETMKSLWECFVSSGFWISFLNTVLRTAIAFIVSFFLAVLFAVMGIISKSFGLFIKPFISVFRTLPTLAVILILLCWTTPVVAPTAVTVLVLFPMIYSQINTAVSGIDGGIIDMAKVYKITEKEKLAKIYLPMIAPSILAQTGANISLGIKVMISAEVLAGTYRSLGGLMQNARLYIDMPKLTALTVVAVLMGFAVDLLFSFIGKGAFKWSRKQV